MFQDCSITIDNAADELGQGQRFKTCIGDLSREKASDVTEVMTVTTAFPGSAVDTYAEGAFDMTVQLP